MIPCVKHVISCVYRMILMYVPSQSYDCSLHSTSRFSIGQIFNRNPKHLRKNGQKEKHFVYWKHSHGLVTILNLYAVMLAQKQKVNLSSSFPSIRMNNHNNHNECHSIEQCILRFVQMPIEDPYLEQRYNKLGTSGGIGQPPAAFVERMPVPVPFADAANPIMAQVWHSFPFVVLVLLV
jgi:hypothetical protein